MIKELLTNKTSKEKSQIKSLEIAKKKCRGCNREFLNENPRVKPSHFSKKVFCSKQCAYSNRGGSKNANWIGGKAKANCEKCGNEFSYQKTGFRGRFCSFKCVRLSAKVIARRTMIEKKCFQCGLVFTGYPERKYCSQKCSGLGITGENFYNWKGGELNKQFHHRKRKALLRGAEGSHTQQEWENLKKKYDYMCLCCKQKEPFIKLTEDHIIPIKKSGTNNIDNIQPLCASCNSRKYVSIIDFRPQHQYAN